MEKIINQRKCFKQWVKWTCLLCLFLFLIFLITDLGRCCTKRCSQVKLAKNEVLPVISVFKSNQNQDDNGNYLSDWIEIYNYGKSLHSLYAKSDVLIKLEPGCSLSSNIKEILLKNFYTANQYEYDHRTDQYPKTTDDKNLIMTIYGNNDNESVFKNLSDEFYQDKGCYLTKSVFIEINYDDDLFNEYHQKFYKLNGFEVSEIDPSSARVIIKANQTTPSVDLNNTNIQQIAKLLGLKAKQN